MSNFQRNTFWVEEVNSYVAIPEEMSPEALAAPLESERPDDYEYELPEGAVELDCYEDTARRMLALMIHDGSTVPPTEERGNRFSWGNRDFLVVTDDEADDLWDQELEHYLDECVLSELPEIAQNYFDRDAWKRDARYDGRGHALASYDGNEYDEEVDDQTFYIFRI